MHSDSRFPIGWDSNPSIVLDRISRIATGKSSLRIISAGSRLALALPVDLTAAGLVIDLYQPQRLKGRIFRCMAHLIAATRVARYAPSHSGNFAVTPVVSWLRAAADAGTIGFLGCNPAHGWRCVLAGIDPNTSTSFIAKLGMDQGAAAVLREHELLQNLHGRYPGIVKPMGCESGTDWALLRLSHLGGIAPKTMEEPRINKLLGSWLGEGISPLAENSWAANLIQRVDSTAVPEGWHANMMSRRIRRAFMHGDFAVWNLRVSGDKLCAIDLEWAQEDGIAGVDLAHGLRQEAYMTRKLSPAKAITWMLDQAMSTTWRPYLKAAGWADATEDWLRLGLLHSHFNALNSSTELLDILGIHVK